MRCDGLDLIWHVVMSREVVVVRSPRLRFDDLSGMARGHHICEMMTAHSKRIPGL